MGLLACIKLLSCTGVYRIGVQGNNGSLKRRFKSWGTTVKGTLGLVPFARKSLPHTTLRSSSEEEKATFQVSLCQAVLLSTQLGREKELQLRSNLAGTKYISPSQRQPRAIHSASPRDWRTPPPQRSTAISLHPSNIWLCGFRSITNWAPSVFDTHTGYRLQRQLGTFPLEPHKEKFIATTGVLPR